MTASDVASAPDRRAASRARQTFMIAAIAKMLAGIGHVAVGSTSPIPAAAALLARRRDPAMRVSLLGSARHNVFTDGNRELFDCAAQGRIDAFFLSGGQIDARGRINLVGTGPYPRTEARFPGSFGSAFLYPLVPRVILFREAHSPRILVEAVDFVSAAPGSAERGDRNDGPHALVTGRAVFRWSGEFGRFALAGLAPGETRDTVAAATGFAFSCLEPVEVATIDPGLDTDIDEIVEGDLTDDYPAFVRARLSR
ncbi:CoA synthetase [uncultured Enterovirga sp.]|uniref:CoA synthetase n=1 Tax=uncultured Enterovirga sp. TaxID=2026352 RepID=UPI0035CB9B7B